MTSADQSGKRFLKREGAVLSCNRDLLVEIFCSFASSVERAGAFASFARSFCRFPSGDASCGLRLVWRVIWTDGRDLPKDPDTSLYGYSVGTWVDDNTFVVQTVGMDERTWLDNSGDGQNWPKAVSVLEFLGLEPAVGLEPTTPTFGRPTSAILDKPSLGKSPTRLH